MISIFVFLARYNQNNSREDRGERGHRSLIYIVQKKMVIFRFKVHDLSDSRKTNEIYGGLFNDSANRFMEYIDKNYKKIQRPARHFNGTHFSS